MSIAETVRTHARPGTWIIDFTNPVGIVTRALLEAGHQAVGLCNVAIGFQRRFAGMLGVTHDRVSLGHVGLNHLTWETSVKVDGVERLPELLGERLIDSRGRGRTARHPAQRTRARAVLLPALLLRA